MFKAIISAALLIGSSAFAAETPAHEEAAMPAAHEAAPAAPAAAAAKPAPAKGHKGAHHGAHKAEQH